MNDEFPIFSGGWQTAKLRRKLRAADGIRIGPFGSSLTLDQMVSDGYKVYGQENVISDDFTAGSRYITPSKYAELKACSITSGDLLVTMMGTTGRCCVVPKDIQVGIMDSHLIRLRFQKEIDPDYMALLIDKGHYIREQIGAAGKGTIMSGLNSAIIKDVWIGLPDLKIQRHLVQYVAEQTGKIDRLLDMRRRQMALLKEQRAALIQEAVTRGLNPNAPMKDSGLPWLGEIPIHWQVKRLKHIAYFVKTGGTPPSARLDYYDDNGMDWYGPGDFTDSLRLSASVRRVSDAAIRDNYAVVYKPPVILIVGIGASVGKIGIATQPCFTNQQVNAIGLRLDHSAFFFANFLTAYSNIIAANANHSTLPIFNQTQTRNFLVAVPPQFEQVQIVKFIQQEEVRFDSLHAAYTRQLTLLTEYRAALIHECVTGQRCVPDTGNA